jgi:hypothetical protein
MTEQPVEVRLDPAAAGAVFPPIHRGRYEVDPWATGLRTPLPEGLRSAARRAGVRLLRMGIGCWLPSQDPDPSSYAEREWFHGTTLADTRDPAQYDWTHLDRNLDVCRELGVELLLSFDYMPASLARPGPQKLLPEALRQFAPEGYQFPNGVRDAPPADPQVFAEACVVALRHVRERGVPVAYVELWNEPDLPLFYSGEYDDYFATYAAFARRVSTAGHLVGGPSWAGVLERELWLDRFLSDCAGAGVPLDFYSFHRYDSEVDKVIERCRDVRAALDRAGLTATRALLDEWGYDLRQAEYFGTVGNAAFTAACLMQLPAAGVADQTQVLLVDPGNAPPGGRFHGLTRQDGVENPVALCLAEFEAMQQTPLRIPTPYDEMVLAGTDGWRSRLRVLLTNPDKVLARSCTIELPAGATGVVEHLTAAGFAATGGWTDGASVGADARVTVELPPESLARLRVALRD